MCSGDGREAGGDGSGEGGSGRKTQEGDPWQGRYSAILPYKGFPPPSIGGAAGKRPRLENGTPALSAAGVLLAQDPASHHAVRSWVAAVLCVCRLLLCVPPLRFQGARVTAVRDCICTMCVFVCVFYYCRTYYKAVRVGGGGEWRTCAMRDYETRPVWTCG